MGRTWDLLKLEITGETNCGRLRKAQANYWEFVRRDPGGYIKVQMYAFLLLF